jgi:hypothetical protein
MDGKTRKDLDRMLSFAEQGLEDDLLPEYIEQDLNNL